MRPASIVRFERLYFVALAVWLLSYFVGWSGYVAQAAGETAGQGVSGEALLIGTIAVAALVQAGIGYAAARGAKVWAKWLLAVWFVVSMAQLALALFRAGFAIDLATIVWIIWFGLFGWAVSYLFQPDADTWFAKPL